MPRCTTSLLVTPQSATANHTSATNFQQFGASETAPSGCAVPALAFAANWTTSDPADVSISSAPDNTNGKATCLNATPGPVTVTATVPGVSPPLTGTAMLTCN